MKRNYKILAMLIGICLGSLSGDLIISNWIDAMHSNLSFPARLSDEIWFDIVQILSYMFQAAGVVAIVYSAIIFRHRIIHK
jgi:hypothetical protein